MKKIFIIISFILFLNACSSIHEFYENRSKISSIVCMEDTDHCNTVSSFPKYIMNYIAVPIKVVDITLASLVGQNPFDTRKGLPFVDNMIRLPFAITLDILGTVLVGHANYDWLAK